MRRRTRALIGQPDVRIVAALGGNALARRGESISAEVQRRNLAVAAAALAPLAREHEFVLTFGDGPQIGHLLLESEADEARGHRRST